MLLFYTDYWFSSSSLTLFLKDAASDKFKGGEHCPLLLKGGGMGGHGAWRDATNVSMVPSAGDKEHRPAHSFPKHLGGKGEQITEESKKVCSNK